MKFKPTNCPAWLKRDIPQLGELFDKYFDNLLGESWISVNFVKKSKVQELNAKYNKLDMSTDVLSFPFVFVDSGEKVDNEELGEIYISEDVVKENAKEYKVKYEEELLRVLIHGALHILGYDHKGNLNVPEPEDKEMFDMQEFLLQEILKK